MVSSSLCFRRAVRGIALAAVVLLLCGCSKAALSHPEAADPLPSLPEYTGEPTEHTAPLPQPSGATEPSEPQPEETSPCGFWEPQGTVTLFPLTEGMGLRIAQDQQLLSAPLPEEEISFRSDSLDASACLLLSTRNRLWLVRDGELLSIGDCGGFAALSALGTGVIYMDQGGILCHYLCDSGETVSICARVGAAAISPDGNTIAYSTINPDGSTTAWLWMDGTARLLGEELLPIALSDNAQLIYALGTGDNHLHILDDTGAAVVPSCPVDTGAPIFLNANHRQILFCREGIWCLWEGGEAVAVSDAPLAAPALPRDCRSNIWGLPGFSGSTLPTDNLWGHFYLDQGNSLYYLEPGHTATLVSDNLREDSLWASRDGSTVFYLWTDGTLFRTQRNCPGSPTILAANIASFAPTSDLGCTYCLDSEGTLWYLEDFHDPKAIREGVLRMAVTWDDYCLYLTESEEDGLLLWASLRSTEGIAVDTQVTMLLTTPTAAYYSALKEEGESMFCATDAITFMPLES